jgi:fatty-acyl-CoA synthase
VLGTEVRIVDESDAELPRGEVGEIIARGPQIMKGYWNLPDASEKALRGGWMHTGDAARMDEDGYVYIQDRIKDMIVTGGENVYPREVENALFAHPAVADVAVIGIPDPKFGEAILAFVVLREGHSVAADELIAFARARIAGYKVPRKIEVLDALPRNASGKVLKKDLREPYWQGHQRRVGG